MRIIGGKLKGINLKAPDKLPVRPTTDKAKEALFNILGNQYDIENCSILDLFSGTGNISIEFASREAEKVKSIDRDFGCIKWLEAVKSNFGLTQIETQKMDVFKYLDLEKQAYDIVFADPPYDMPQINTLPIIILKNGLLKKNGLLIVEHPVFLKFNQLEGFQETRKYGNSSFSFFANP